jgi:hypothetical protein
MASTTPDEKGLAAARRLAGWELGDGYWADKLIRAYLNPEEAHRALDADDVPKVTGVRRY